MVKEDFEKGLEELTKTNYHLVISEYETPIGSGKLFYDKLLPEINRQKKLFGLVTARISYDQNSIEIHNLYNELSKKGHEISFTVPKNFKVYQRLLQIIISTIENPNSVNVNNPITDNVFYKLPPHSRPLINESYPSSEVKKFLKSFPH